MSFIARCVFCDAQVQAPDQAAGWSVQCPKCFSSFTAVPSAAMPRAPAAKPRPAPKPSPAPRPAPPARSEAVTLPRSSPVAPRPRVSPASSPEQTSRPIVIEEPPPPACEAPEPVLGPVPRPRRFSLLGLAALFAAALALICASLPWVHALTLPLCALALLLGVAGIFSVLMRTEDMTLLILPAAGFVVAGAIPLAALLLPSFLGYDIYRLYWNRTGHDPAVISVIPLDPRNTTLAGLEQDGWADASRAAVQQDRVRVQVTAASVDGVQLKTPKKPATTKEKYLLIDVRAQHVGAAGEFTYEGWGLGDDKNQARLTDNTGRTYARKSFDPGVEVIGQNRGESVHPGRSAEDLLVFEAPPANVEYLRLELPASACGGTGVFRLTIPRSLIRLEKR